MSSPKFSGVRRLLKVILYLAEPRQLGNGPMAAAVAITADATSMTARIREAMVEQVLE